MGRDGGIGAINPDVVGAIARLRAAGVVTDPKAALFARVARRELVSVRFEIRALLYLGVLLLTSGVGVLLAGHHQDVGPLAIAVAIGLAAAGCLAWVARVSPPFSWGETPPSFLAFDYVLLLGPLPLAADLAYGARAGGQSRRSHARPVRARSGHSDEGLAGGRFGGGGAATSTDAVRCARSSNDPPGARLDRAAPVG